MTQVIPQAFRTFGPSDTIAEDQVVPHYLDDRKLRISVARIDDRLYAFEDLCTCADERCPLSGGLLEGATVMCQCHGTRYDLATGSVISGPAKRPLVTYEVKETDGAVRILV